METVITCLLLLPSDVGGMALALPASNYEVTLDGPERKLARRKCCYIDIAWPDRKIGIEYDGAEDHTDIIDDRNRREALAHKGWRIYVLQIDEVKSFRQLQTKLVLATEGIPMRRRARSAGTEEQEHLFNRLLTATRFGLGVNNVLFGVPVRNGAVRTHV